MRRLKFKQATSVRNLVNIAMFIGTTAMASSNLQNRFATMSNLGRDVTHADKKRMEKGGQLTTPPVHSVGIWGSATVDRKTLKVYWTGFYKDQNTGMIEYVVNAEVPDGPVATTVRNQWLRLYGQLRTDGQMRDSDVLHCVKWREMGANIMGMQEKMRKSLDAVREVVKKDPKQMEKAKEVSDKTWRGMVEMANPMHLGVLGSRELDNENRMYLVGAVWCKR